jgi:hypothetical protein
VISEILTIFKADTSDMKSGIRELKGEQKQLAEAELAAANARNKQLEDWTKGNGKAKAGLEALKSSMMLMSKSLEMMGLQGSRVTEVFGSMSAVMSTIGGKGGIVAGLAVGFVQLVSAVGDYLHETSEAEHIQWKFNVAIGNAKDAVTQGAEAVRMAHREMVELSLQTTLGADAAKAFVVAWQNMDTMLNKDSFRKLFFGGWREQERGPFGNPTDAFQSLYAEGPKDNPFTYKDADETGVRAANRIAAREAEIAAAKEELAVLQRTWESYDHGKLSVGLYRQEREKLLATINGTVGGKGKPGRGDVSQYIGGMGLEEGATSSVTGNRLLGFTDERGKIAMYDRSKEHALAQQASQDVIYEAEELERNRRDLMQRLANERESQNIGQLEKIFGPIEQFELYEQGFAHLGATFGAFSEAMGAGYEAIVTGQGGVAAAIKQSLADGLMAIGKSSVVEALRQTALGFGALAFGSPTAAMHFKSAAMHGAVAVAAGLAANSLGTSAQVAASDKAAAEKSKEEEKAKKEREKAAGSGGGSGGQGERPIYILMGSAYDESTPRMRRVMANDAVEKALRERDE